MMQWSQKRVVTEYRVETARVTRPVTFAVVADLHGGGFADVLPALSICDAILVPGDLVDRHHPALDEARAFLAQAPKLAPVFYSLGNHERKHAQAAQWRVEMAASEATILDDRVVRFGEIALGGLSSSETPTGAVVAELAAEPGFRLLLCHHPEYYDRLVRGRGVDLTVAGHAHGGQVRLLGRGLYAPGQGFFPRLTGGMYDGGHLLVSRGMSNFTKAPRVNNPCELVVLHIVPKR